MTHSVPRAAYGVLVALVMLGCAKPAQQADSTAIYRPPDTLKATAPDTTKTTTSGKSPDTRLRDSVLKPGVGGHKVTAVPSISDTAKRRPPN